MTNESPFKEIEEKISEKEAVIAKFEEKLLQLNLKKNLVKIYTFLY